MVTLSESFKRSDDKSEVMKLRNEFHQTRADYELGLRKFILNDVKNCPCCFKGLMEKTKESVKARAFYSDFEPDELDVLENMYFISNNESEGAHE